MFLDFFYVLIVWLLGLLIGYGFGFWLFVPWFANRREAARRQAWVVVWATGWLLQVVGWAIYFPTYGDMDRNPGPVDFSKGLMGLSCLLWIVAFSLYRKARPLGVVILSALLVACVAVPECLPDGPPTPTDPEMIASFHRHQAAFDQLERMAQEDNNGQQGRIDSASTPEDLAAEGTPTGRVVQYRKLLALVGVKNCTWIDGGDINLEVWGTGNALSSDMMEGYAYRTKAPANVLTSLSQCPRPDDRTFVEAYQHIQGHWYLYYTYIPS